MRSHGITFSSWSCATHELIRRVCVCVRLCVIVYLHLHWPRAVFRRVHSSTVGYKLQNFLVAATWIWHVAQREDLPQQNPEWPERGRRWKERLDRGKKERLRTIVSEIISIMRAEGVKDESRGQELERKTTRQDAWLYIKRGRGTVRGDRRSERTGGDRRWHHINTRVRASHHVSVLDVKMPSMKASGGIHFTGSMARPPFL